MKFNTKLIFFTLIILVLGYTVFEVFLKMDKEITNTETISLHIETFKVGDGWGFNLYKNEKIIIHQEHIPAINGYKNFKSEKDAEKLAELMKFKIKTNIFPPSINLKELDSLNIIP